MSRDAFTSLSIKTLGPRKHRTLLRDLYASGQDPIALAQTHGLTLGELVSFAEDPRTGRELGALIGLSDNAARALLSRFRTTAVTRLAQLASGDEHAPPETVRRACNDLLKLNIPLPNVSQAEGHPVDPGPEQAMESLRRDLYGAGDAAQPE